MTDATSYDHIYLSPHFDDAALSCGGMIAAQTVTNQQVLVFTICSGIPLATQPFSAFAQYVHTTWNLAPDQVLQSRLEEDQAAMKCLGADGFYAGFLDAIYRQPHAYVDNETLFGHIAAEDTLVRDLSAMLVEFANKFPTATWYVPLGVGHHVDHCSIYHAARSLLETGVSMVFYEDFPYVAVPGALQERLQEIAVTGSLVSQVVGIEPTIERKIEAIKAYTSQLEVLFGGVEPMAQAVMTYARQVQPQSEGYAERVWRHSDPA